METERPGVAAGRIWNGGGSVTLGFAEMRQSRTFIRTDLTWFFDKWGRGGEQMVGVPQGEWRLPRCTLRALWPSGPQGSEQQPRSGLRYAVTWERGRGLNTRNVTNEVSIGATTGGRNGEGRRRGVGGADHVASAQIDLPRNNVPCSLSNTWSWSAWQKPLPQIGNRFFGLAQSHPSAPSCWQTGDDWSQTANRTEVFQTCQSV